MNRFFLALLLFLPLLSSAPLTGYASSEGDLVVAIETSTDNVTPSIFLNSPLDNASLSAGVISFSFNASDVGAGLALCNLTLNSSDLLSTSALSETASNSFVQTLGEGTYTWSIWCRDHVLNENRSLNRSFSVSVAEEEEETTTTIITSGGGGGTTIIQGVAGAFRPNYFEVAPQTLLIELLPGEVVERDIAVVSDHDSNQTLSLSQRNLDSFLVNLPASLFLDSRGSEILRLRFAASPSVNPGVYVGQVLFSREGEVEEIFVRLEVNTPEALFDVKLTIPSQFQRLSPGDDFFGEVTVQNFGELDRVDVALEYGLKDSSGKILISSVDTFAVDTPISTSIGFALPRTLPPGDYVVYVIARSGKHTAVSSEVLFVQEDSALIAYLAWALLFLVVLSTLIRFLSVFQKKDKKGPISEKRRKQQ